MYLQKMEGENKIEKEKKKEKNFTHKVLIRFIVKIGFYLFCKTIPKLSRTHRAACTTQVSLFPESGVGEMKGEKIKPQVRECGTWNREMRSERGLFCLLKLNHRDSFVAVL